jgi:predicted nuclease of predicted toxin-antitoxin system
LPAEERFLADEGVDFRLVTALRERYPVVSIAEENPSVTDEEVLKLAVDTDSVLLTEDKDFGEMVFRRGLSLPGVVLIRLHGVQGAEKVHLIQKVFEQHLERLRGSFSVVTGKAIRIRAID